MTIDMCRTSTTRIETALDRFFAGRAQKAASYGPDFAHLWDLTAAHSRGGKLLRPRLFIDVLEGFATEAVLPDASAEVVDRLAAVQEVLHYAFLLHDDVIDGDLVRRHQPNLIGTIRDTHPEAPAGASLHWGTSTAILMGDVLLSTAVLECARLPLADGPREQVLDLIDDAITETVAGEYLDVGLSDRVITPTLDTVMTMTTLKTATYSFALPLRLAAVLAGAPAGIDRALAQVGHHLGFAFQVQDDLLTMFGHHGAHGKDVRSDLREGKQTVLVSHARMTSRWEQIASVFGDPDITDADANRVRTAFEEAGSRSFAEDLVSTHLGEASRILDEAALPVEVRRVIAECIARLEFRSA